MSAPTAWTSSGARRRKITVQKEASTTTTMGFLGSGGWSNVLTTWAKVTPSLQTSVVQAGGSQEPVVTATYVLNIRYVPSVPLLRGMRVVESDGGAVYLIQQVQDVAERHRELNLFCSQVPAPAQQEQ